MLSYHEFKNYYEERGRCPNDFNIRSKTLNERQLRNRYDAYIRQHDKQEARKERYAGTDLDWADVRQEVFHRDNSRCRLFDLLSDEEKAEITVEDSINPLVVDPAHVFPKSVYPIMKYDVDNIVCLNRVFHSRLDTYRHPISNKPISLEDRFAWFQRILGSKKFNELLRRSRQHEE